MRTQRTPVRHWLLRRLSWEEIVVVKVTITILSCIRSVEVGREVRKRALLDMVRCKKVYRQGASSTELNVPMAQGTKFIYTRLFVVLCVVCKEAQNLTLVAYTQLG